MTRSPYVELIVTRK